MKHSPLLLALLAALNLATQTVRAAEEDIFLGELRPPLEQTLGQGHTALWTMPLVATQYQPAQPSAALQKALQAQGEGRYIDALILLEEAPPSAGADTAAGIDLTRASFLLQGGQSQQALELLTPLFGNPTYAADAHALAAMAHLQQDRIQEALKAAQQGQAAGGGMLSALALSYTHQGAGRLKKAHAAMHDYNAKSPQAVTLAREAELALTLDQVQPARTLVAQAEKMEPHPYVIAVGGLTHLLDGQPVKARAAFETALKRDPKDAKALLGLGLAEARLGNLAASLKKLQAANEAEPHNALILTYLGRAQQQAGQLDAAKASWRSARQADPRDPTPWLYQAQAALQANRPLEARESVREAQARAANRAVYRGASLLREDEQVLQANLAEIQRQLGMDNLAFHTLADPVGEKSAATLRNQADLLQGQRFGESARRSLLLQSQFDAHPGALPAPLDIYGDGAGQTGARVPQHGAVSVLSAQQASYHNYDELFNRHAALAADATTASRNTHGKQIRLGVGNDTLGLNLAGQQFKSNGFAQFENLDNRVMQASVQWRPTQSTQAFASYQTFNSLHGEIQNPADPGYSGFSNKYDDSSAITRLGLRHGLTEDSELRGLWSHQQTRQTDNWQWSSDFLPLSDPASTAASAPNAGTNLTSSEAHSAELQYRRRGADYTAQWGASSVRSQLFQPTWYSTYTLIAQQIYADWQQTLNPYWQLQAGLAWGKSDKQLIDTFNTDKSTYLQRWLPKLGLVYTPESTTHVRLAAWKGLDDGAVGNAALAPATLAGIVLRRPSDTYRLVRGIALGADKQLDAAWLLEGQAQRRWTDNPWSNGVQLIMTPQQLDQSRLALHWQPVNQAWQVTLAYDDERIQNDPKIASPDSLQEQHLRAQQLELRWFASPQWTANLAWSHNQLSALQQLTAHDFSGTLIAPLDVRQHFNQTDISLNWKFNRAGSMDIGGRNIDNKSIQYTETDPLTPRFSKGQLWYMRLKLAL